MPILNGLEVCRRLKADPATQQIPVLLISAIGEGYRRTGFEAGADDFLDKPFSPLELQTKIRDLLERHGVAGTGGAGT
jgi:two-component system cell cycle response regulator